VGSFREQDAAALDIEDRSVVFNLRSKVRILDIDHQNLTVRLSEFCNAAVLAPLAADGDDIELDIDAEVGEVIEQGVVGSVRILLYEN